MKDILSLFNVSSENSFYVSAGNSLGKLPQKPFRMNFFNVCLCLEGSTVVEIDNIKFTFQKNSLLTSSPNTTVRFISQSDNFKMKLLFFEKNFLLKNISNPFIVEKSSLFKNHSYNIINLSDDKSTELIKLLNYLKEKSSSDSMYKDELSRTIIFNILLEIADFMDKNYDQNSNPKTIYYQFCQLLQKHISKQKNVQFYADSLCISNKHLITIIKEASGKTPHQVMDEYLLKEAFSLLGNPDKNISEIAFQLNFSAVSSFGRFFKKQTNYSPVDYRKIQNIS
ncbi:AraC-type DNA-binding protein [Soonwooa buanensis]|uniref:AraC-type DNA-binding protein n=1 Tax=Soonwooa buanensis TaxID=619805 RepID=A0A1T5CZY4_9FLAO|nr:AraC family transcriptional regulator [Soonwooa buanensis]SKB64891.1 AraC-type DNA-binding protein [Soonwooa buanensis]